MGGNIASPVNLAVASKIPAAGTMLSRVLGGAAGGSVMGALQPVSGGNFAQEKAKQMAIGGITGGIMPAITGAVARVVRPNAVDNANLQLLKSEGVTPTIGQALGGNANNVEQKMTSLPLVGDMISSARSKANDTFERAAYNRALKPIGAKLPEGLSGRDAIQYTEGALKQSYDDVLNKIGAIKPDNSFSMKLQSLTNMVQNLKAPQENKAAFFSALDYLAAAQDGNGVITSDAYEALESSLGSDARKLGASPNIWDNKVSGAVKQLQSELQSMLKRQAGGYADDLAKTNTAWANFKRVQRAGAAIGADEGSFTPAQLQNAVKAMDRSKDKAAFARGGALMQDLSDAGKSVLGSSVPDSGTAGRLLLNGGALASYFVDPTLASALVGGSALYTSPMQKLLVGAASSRPQLTQPLANAVRRSSPYLVPAVGGLLQ
jgi:hypothetical protein